MVGKINVGGISPPAMSNPASAEDILVNKQAINSSGSIIIGNMSNRGTNKPATSIGLNANGLYYYISEGYYADRANPAYEPWVYAPLESVRNALGLAASKIANGVALAGTTGTYKGLGNASAGDVLTGRTFSTASLSNATGTIADIGSVSHSLPINGSYTIPAGRHSGSGRVTQSVAVQGAQTITPGISNKSIAANRWLSGVQTIAGDPGLVAGNIKKGARIFGVTGTYDGSVAPGPEDLYKEGKFGLATGFSGLNLWSEGTIYLETGYVRIPGLDNDHVGLTTNNSINLTGRKKLCMDVANGARNLTLWMYIHPTKPTSLMQSGWSARLSFDATYERHIVKIDITNVDLAGYIAFVVTMNNREGGLWRLWFE